MINILILVLAISTSLMGCVKQDQNDVHRVTDGLSSRSMKINEAKLKGFEEYFENKKGLLSCQKFAKNPDSQCYELKLNFIKSIGYICGLKAEIEFLDRVIENSGEINNENSIIDVDCSFDD